MALLRRAIQLLAIVTASTNLVPDSLYFGRYKCGNYAHLMLHIERVGGEGIDAIFHFLYPSSTQHGAYFMRGSYNTTAAASSSSNRSTGFSSDWQGRDGRPDGCHLGGQ